MDPKAAWVTYGGGATRKKGGARDRFMVPKDENPTPTPIKRSTPKYKMIVNN